MSKAHVRLKENLGLFSSPMVALYGFTIPRSQVRKPSSCRSLWSDRSTLLTVFSTLQLFLQLLQVNHRSFLTAAAIFFLAIWRGYFQIQTPNQEKTGNYNMPPKKNKGKDIPVTDIKSYMQQDRPAKMSLRSEVEQDNIPSMAEPEEGSGNDLESEDTYIDCDTEQAPVEEQMSINELAKMLTSQISEVRIDIKTLNEKFTENSDKIDKLNQSMTEISHRVEAISSENKSTSESVKVNRVDIDEIIRQQNDFNLKQEEFVWQQQEFNLKHEEIIKLAESLKEKDLMIEHMHRRIENLEEEKNMAKDREEIKEQHGRKMNLWVYGVDEPEKENMKKTLNDFCTSVLGLRREVVEGWLIKNVHRVGDYKMAKRPIIVAFVLWDDRQTMLRANKNVYQYNSENDTSYAVIKTDLAPRARQLRKDLNYANQRMKAAEKCEGRVRDNPKGHVWLERKEKKEDRYWETVHNINPDYLPPGLARQIQN